MKQVQPEERKASDNYKNQPIQKMKTVINQKQRMGMAPEETDGSIHASHLRIGNRPAPKLIG